MPSTPADPADRGTAPPAPLALPAPRPGGPVPPEPPHPHAALLRRVRAATGWPWASLELAEHLLPTSLGRLAADSGRAEHLADAADDERLTANPWVDGRIARTRALAALPVTAPGGQLLAVLVARDHQPHPADSAREAALADLADLAAGSVLADRQARALGGLAAAVAAADQRVALAQAGLADRHDLLEAVLDTADVGVIALDASGRVSVLSPLVRTWAGLPGHLDAPAAARAATTALCADAAGTVLSAVRGPLLAALAAGGQAEAEVVFASATGAVVTCVCRTRALTGADGARAGAVASLTDVSAERAARAELERSNAELEAFAGIAAHDLRSPLTVVDGYLEVLEDDAAARGDARAAGWAGTARRSAGRMASLLGALLAYATAGAPGQAPRQPVPLRPLLEAVLADLQVPAGATVTLPRDAAVVLGDPVQLHQLLSNLVGNALKFTRPGTPAAVTCSVRELPGGCELLVADHGPGVPAGQRQAVFRAFERGAHRSGTATGAGAQVVGHGLGLATAQRIVARHGGRISLDETPGGGLTVRVLLPRP
ncbi:sensor histidine kinase [Quadrisphaera sp. KR29]|uniref:sensor histidine kinase n=1 Tax=Quadrisphaera sp. KR29 TaxID=3461391 RepID=UPI004043C6AE